MVRVLSILRKIFCDTLGWHDYQYTIDYPPTPGDEPVMEMTEHTECRRCQDIKTHIKWKWDVVEQDFYNIRWLWDK